MLFTNSNAQGEKPPRRNSSHLFELPANNPPARPRSNKFTDPDIVKCNVSIRDHLRGVQFDAALRLFNSMPRKSAVSYGILMFGYLSRGEFKLAHRLLDKMFVKNLVAGNMMICGNIKKKNLAPARRLVDEMPVKDVVLWTTILSGYVQNGLLDEAKRVFDEMRKKNVVLCNTILSGYALNGFLDESSKVSDEMPVKNLVGWNIMICGNIKKKNLGSVRRLIDEMPVKNVISWNRCGSIKEAYEVFKRIEDKNAISWNSIIIGYGRHGFGQEALQHFESIKQTSIQPDEVTMGGVLSTCSHTGLVMKGKHYFYSTSRFGQMRRY